MDIRRFLQHTCTSRLVKCVQFLVVVPLQVDAGNFPLFRATASSVVVSTSLFIKSHSSLDRSTFFAAANGMLQNWQGSIVQLVFAWGGHMLKVGHNSQTSGMCLTVVLNSTAILPFVQSHITLPSSHSRRRFERLPTMSHFRHKFVAAIWFLCNRSCVGTMSCTALYQSIFMSSCTGVSCMLLHNVAQSVIPETCDPHDWEFRHLS